MAGVSLRETGQKMKGQNVTADAHHAAAVERGKAAVRKLQEQGIIDQKGKRIRTDMREGSNRDFGG
jgi:hypothetical protein